MSKRLFIIDGYGIIYRSYFAFITRPLTDADGKNVSAIFGFFNTLMKIIKEHNPEYLVVALDSPTKTFRHEMYPEYKANRDKAPEDLHAQVPRIVEILNAVGIPIKMQNGMEADDIIATLTVQATKLGLDSVIVTGDKDLMQLVNDHVFVLRPPKKDEKDYMLCSEKEVPDIYGVRPDQIVDYLTILGDSSDNVPGIKGLGEKGAQKLLGEYGTLDEVYKNIESLSKGVQEKLRAATDHIELSRKLILLKSDLFEISDFDEEGFSSASLDWSKAVPKFEAVKSRQLITLAKQLGAEVKIENVTKVTTDEPEFSIKMKENPLYTLITDINQLKEALDVATKDKIMALDTETTSLDVLQANLVGISFSNEIGRAWYVPLSLFDQDEVLKIFEEKLRDVSIVGQNIKYDYNILRRVGLELKNLGFDTMIAAWLLNSDSGVYNMDDLADRYLGYKTIKYQDVVEEGDLFSSVSLENACKYSCEDSDVTWALYKLFSHELEKKGLLSVLTNIEMPLIKSIADMEYNGIILDKEKIQKLGETFSKEQKKVELQIFELCNKEFNLNSPKQLQEVLFVDRKLPTGKKTHSGFSTNSEVLENLAQTTDDPVPALILQSRMYGKLKSYCESLPVLINKNTKRIHPSYLQTGTGTGRLSCKSPNLQNIPIRTQEGRLIRGSFVAREGFKLLSADYSQIELVVLAHYSEDPTLTQAFRDGEDVHRVTASLIFDVFPEMVTPQQRQIAKTINFGVIYGMSAFRLSGELGISKREAQSFIDSYFERYKGITSFIERTKAEAKEKLMVKTMFGHHRLIPQMASSNKLELASAQRVAVNSVIQGTAAEIMKIAMINITKALEGYESKLLLQVHDELILEVKESELEQVKDLVNKEMTGAVKLRVPLRCSIETGDDWGQMH